MEALRHFIRCGAIILTDGDTNEPIIVEEEVFSGEKTVKGKNIKLKTLMNNSVIDKMGYFDKKLLSYLLFGQAKDGTTLINASLKLNLSYFLDRNISDWILTADIKKRLAFQEI